LLRNAVSRAFSALVRAFRCAETTSLSVYWLSVYDALFLDKPTRRQLTEHVAELLGLTTAQLVNVYTRGSADVTVHVTDNVSNQYTAAKETGRRS